MMKWSLGPPCSPQLSHWGSPSSSPQFRRDAGSPEFFLEQSSPPRSPPPDIFERARFDDRTRFVGDNNVVQSTLILCNVIIAMGVLSIPYTFRLEGYLTFGIMGIAAFLVVRTSRLVYLAVELAEPIACVNDVAPKYRDWAYLASLAYGTWGRNAARVVLMSSLTSYIVAFLSALGVLFNRLIPACSQPAGIALATCLSLSLTRLPMKALGRASLAAHLSFLVAYVCLLATGWCNFRQKRAPSLSGLLAQRAQEMEPNWLQIANIPSVFYVFVFAMAGTSVLPSILNNMEDRAHFGRVLLTSYFIAVVVYILVGLTGFLLFGNRTSELFTSNLGTDVLTGSDLRGLQFIRTIASVSIICKLALCIPVLAYPIFSDVKKMLAKRHSTRFLVTCRWPISRYFWRTPFLVSMGLCAALFGERVAIAVSVVGAIFGAPLVFFMPVIVYIGLSNQYQKRIGFLTWLELITIVLVGGLLSCFAIVNCYKQLFHSDR